MRNLIRQAIDLFQTYLMLLKLKKKIKKLLKILQWTKKEGGGSMERLLVVFPRDISIQWAQKKVGSLNNFTHPDLIVMQQCDSKRLSILWMRKI